MNPHWILGKRVDKVWLRPFKDGKGGTAHDPIIEFGDGSRISFTVEETEVGEYGVRINYQPPPDL